jgi:protein SCO1/2
MLIWNFGDPTEARRLKLMENAMATKSNAIDVLHVGQSVPNFSLTDQIGHLVSLFQFKGKVLAVTFIYTRCPFPTNVFACPTVLACCRGVSKVQWAAT